MVSLAHPPTAEASARSPGTSPGPGARAGPFSDLAVEARQLDEQIYDALRQKILLRQLPPGSRLSIRGLADHLGVSVTPVRDALRRLQTDGSSRCAGAARRP